MGPLPRPPAPGGHQLRHPGVPQPPGLVGLLGCYMHMPVCTSRSKQLWCCLERTVFVARMRDWHGLACAPQSHSGLHTSKSAEQEIGSLPHFGLHILKGVTARGSA